MSGSGFPEGLCTLLVNHHAISQPSTASWRLAFSSQRLSGPCYSHCRVACMLRSNGSWGTCIPQGITTFLHYASRRNVAPQYVAEEILQGGGFTEVQYVQEVAAQGTGQPLPLGHADLGMAFSGPLIVRVDAGDPIVMLAGVHVGCYEVFGTDRVRAVRDLKGKTVAVPELGSAHHLFLAS